MSTHTFRYLCTLRIQRCLCLTKLKQLPGEHLFIPFPIGHVPIEIAIVHTEVEGTLLINDERQPFLDLFAFFLRQLNFSCHFILPFLYPTLLCIDLLFKIADLHRQTPERCHSAQLSGTRCQRLSVFQPAACQRPCIRSNGQCLMLAFPI